MHPYLNALWERPYVHGIFQEWCWPIKNCLHTLKGSPSNRETCVQSREKRHNCVCHAFIDCIYVKINLNNIPTHYASLWGGLQQCAFGHFALMKIFYDKIHTHEASPWGGLLIAREWTALVCFWRLLGDFFSGKIYTHEASLWGGLPWYAHADVPS